MSKIKKSVPLNEIKGTETKSSSLKERYKELKLIRVPLRRDRRKSFINNIKYGFGWATVVFAFLFTLIGLLSGLVWVIILVMKLLGYIV